MSEKQGETPTIQAPPMIGPGSSRDAWAWYAKACGVEVTDEMKRADIINALPNDITAFQSPPTQTLAEAFDEGYQAGLRSSGPIQADIDAGYAKGKAEGYKEGWDAAQEKNRLPLFEAARKWAFEHAVQIAGFRRFLDADSAGLFAEIQAEYPDEKLIRSDRELIFNAVKRDLKKRESLADATVELSAGRKNEMRRTVSDIETVVVS